MVNMTLASGVTVWQCTITYSAGVREHLRLSAFRQEVKDVLDWQRWLLLLLFG